MTRLYVIGGGGLFVGTLEQAQDCFFSNATPDLLAMWAADQGHSFEVVDVEDVAAYVHRLGSMFVGG